MWISAFVMFSLGLRREEHSWRQVQDRPLRIASFVSGVEGWLTSGCAGERIHSGRLETRL